MRLCYKHLFVNHKLLGQGTTLYRYVERVFNDQQCGTTKVLIGRRGNLEEDGVGGRWSWRWGREEGGRCVEGLARYAGRKVDGVMSNIQEGEGEREMKVFSVRMWNDSRGKEY